MSETLELIRKARSRSIRDQDYQFAAFGDVDFIDISIGLLKTFSQIYIHPSIDLIDEKLQTDLLPQWIEVLTEFSVYSFDTSSWNSLILPPNEYFNRFLISDPKLVKKFFESWPFILEASSKALVSSKD